MGYLKLHFKRCFVNSLLIILWWMCITCNEVSSTLKWFKIIIDAYSNKITPLQSKAVLLLGWSYRYTYCRSSSQSGWHWPLQNIQMTRDLFSFTYIYYFTYHRQNVYRTELWVAGTVCPSWEPGFTPDCLVGYVLCVCV